VRGGLVSVEQFRVTLTALGYNDEEVDGFAFEQESRALVEGVKQTIKAEQQLAAKVQRALVTAAVTLFRKGIIDAVALLVALLAAGLEVMLAAASVAGEVARAQPKAEAS
jgi:hypothetical protein